MIMRITKWILNTVLAMCITGLFDILLWKNLENSPHYLLILFIFFIAIIALNFISNWIFELPYLLFPAQYHESQNILYPKIQNFSSGKNIYCIFVKGVPNKIKIEIQNLSDNPKDNIWRMNVGHGTGINYNQYDMEKGIQKFNSTKNLNSYISFIFVGKGSAYIRIFIFFLSLL